MAERRATFGPVVLVGLAAGTLAAVASARPWAEGQSGRVDTASSGYATDIAITSAQEMPLAAALSLVVLACWGVILVTRGRVRRVVAGLAVVAAAGLVATCVVGFDLVQDALGEALRTASGTDTAAVGLTGWYAAACGGAVVSLAAAAGAVALAPHWPEMGSRYDAPAGTETEAETGAATAKDQPVGNLDLWKAIDEGRDPTV
jgi:uncharacterized membrane protein (TIGR02234 family)